MNKEKRNVVLVGFNDWDKHLALFYRHKRYGRFPKVIFVDTLEEGLKHQGFMIVIKTDEEFDNFVDYDINNRHLFHKFVNVEICSTKYKYFSRSNDFSKIRFYGSARMRDYDYNIFIAYYKWYIEKEDKKFTQKRKNNIEKLHNYLKGKRFVTTEEIVEEFKVSDRWVLRYMTDVNDIYQNIGYDSYKKRWYIVKQR